MEWEYLTRRLQLRYEKRKTVYDLPDIGWMKVNRTEE